MMGKYKIRRQRGFTLIELLLVIGVIGVLSAIVVVAVNPADQLRKARDTQRENEVAQIQKALEQYYIKNSDFPATILQGWGNSYPICQEGQTDASCINIDALIPDYIGEIPVDPSETGTLHTGYEAYQDSGRPFVIASRLGESFPTDYIARYRFTQTEGTTLIDTSGNGYDLIAGASYVPVYAQQGHIEGYAAKFESTVSPLTYDYFYSGTNIVAGAQEATFCSWAKRFNFRSGGVIYRNWTTNYYNYLFGYQAGSVIYDHTGNGTTYIAPNISQTVFTDNVWHHLCTVFDGGENIVKFYIDDTISTGNTSFSTLGPSGTTTYLGIYWNGLIDDVRIYDRALSAVEIQALYEEGPTE